MSFVFTILITYVNVSGASHFNMVET